MGGDASFFRPQVDALAPDFRPLAIDLVRPADEGEHTATARAQCPALREKRISPHTLRHTCALSILQATGDIRKVSLWLGHAHQSTTEIYLQADPTEKIAALESSVPLRLRPGRFRPADRLLASLMPSKTPPPPAPG